MDEVAGDGHLTVVYRGHHLGVDAPIAIKCLNLPATVDHALFAPVVRSFREGCRLHYRLARGSLDIAQTLASGTTLAPRGGVEVSYVVREWLDGHPLGAELASQRLRTHKGMPLGQAMALLEGAARGLAFAHTHGVAHLAIDPTNLFVVIEGKERNTKILDFGLAAALDQAAQVAARADAGVRLGAPQYAAPEQIEKGLGAPGPRTDVYALALVLLEALCGRAVIAQGEGAADAVLDPKKRPTPRSLGLSLSRAVEVELERAVAHAPAQRHADVGAFWAALDRARGKAAPKPVVPAPSPPEEIAAEAIVVAPMEVVAAPPPVAAPPVAAPPVAAPVLAAIAPALGAVPAPARARFRPALVAAVAAGVLVQAAFVLMGIELTATLRAPSHASRAHSTATAVPAPRPPPPVAPPPAPPAEPAAAPEAPPAPPRFDAYAAVTSLAKIGPSFPSCAREGGRWGTGSAAVTFGPDGTVSTVRLSPPLEGTPVGDCVAEKLAAARIPPFATGGHVVWTRLFVPRAPR